MQRCNWLVVVVGVSELGAADFVCGGDLLDADG